MEKELVSVIMSVYNEEERWLRKSIESILKQTYSNLEFLIVIDNPKNNYIIKVINEYAKKDKRIKIIENEKNIGLVASLNRALRIADGVYVARMDADDISISNRLEKELEMMRQKKVDFLMTSLRLIDENGKTICKKSIGDIPSKEFSEIMKYGNISTHPTWFLKKEVYDKLNGYRDIRYCEDYDLILRAIQNGYRCYRMNDILLDYRIRSTGISQSYALEQRMKSRYLRKAYRKGHKLKKYTPTFVNDKFANLTDEKKMKYRNANAEMQLFSIAFEKKKIFSCITIMLKNYFINSYFREDFNDYTKCYLVRKKMKMLEK